MAINLATKFSPKVLDKLQANSVTGVAFNKNYDHEFVGNQTVKIYTTDLAPINDYDNTELKGSRYGGLVDIGDTVQEHTMSQKKSTRFIIDKTFNNDQLMIKHASKVLTEWYGITLMEFRDKYTLGKMITATPADNKLEFDAATESLYEKVLDANEVLDEGLAPSQGRALWVTPEGINILKKDPNFIGANSLAQDRVKFKGQVGEIDGIPVIKTLKRFMTGDVIGILAHPSAVLTPVKIDEAKIVDGGDQASGNIGVALVYFDTFVLKGREACISTITKKA